MRVLLIIGLMVLLAACARGAGEYPRLSDVPSRPETSLTPERSEELAEALREASDEAAAHAAEGRPDASDDQGVDAKEGEE